MWGNNLKVDPTKLPDKNNLRKGSQEGGLEPVPAKPQREENTEISRGHDKRPPREKRNDDYGDNFGGGRGKRRERGDRDDRDYGGRVRC